MLRGVVATTFGGNIPGFDILGMRPDLSQVLVQVKAANRPGTSWPCGASQSFVEIAVKGDIERVVGHRAAHREHFLWAFVCG